MTHTDTPLSPQELTDRLDTDRTPMLVDVRTAAEFEATRIPGSRNLPLGLIEQEAGRIAPQLDGEVVLICRSGGRAERARRRLQAEGLRCRVLAGGLEAYEQTTDSDVERSGNRWAMDRQVRMTAGTLVLLGFLAGQTVSPKLTYLAGAVGAGLTFSALTDSCAMARVLERMPWNRTAAEPSIAQLLDDAPAADGPR